MATAMGFNLNIFISWIEMRAPTVVQAVACALYKAPRGMLRRSLQLAAQRLWKGRRRAI
jgi:hypothetical protein